MGFITDMRNHVRSWLSWSDDEPKRIGIYGPPNAGKSTLANRIVDDWADGEFESAESDIPHETRRAIKKEGIKIAPDETRSLTMDVIDTPGIDTKVDMNEFTEYGLDEETAQTRSREATEGIAEAMRWLKDDLDGVIYVLDSARDPFTETNTIVLGIIESADIPVLVFANKTDKDDANVSRIKSAFPQHTTIELSALYDDLDTVYKTIATTFSS